MTEQLDRHTSPLIDAKISQAAAQTEKKARLPITRVFSTALIIILALFIAISVLSYVRLKDFRVLLSDIVGKSVPSITLSSQIYNQVNSLTFMAERLTNASSEATRRVAMSQISQQLLQLKSLAQSQQSEQHLQVQLNALNLEFRELDELIKLRLASEKVLKEKQQALYALYDRATNLADMNSLALDSNNQYSWTLNISGLVALAGSTFSMNRLHMLRQVGEQISTKLALLDTQVKQLEQPDQAVAGELSIGLRQLLLDENGLIALQVERLQIAGRAIGRGNFVRNLVIDYTGLAEYQAFKINAAVIAESQQAQTRVIAQVRLIGLVSIVAIAVILLVTFFLQSRVVNRLNKLNKRVRLRLDGKKSGAFIDGNDEISDIGQTFDLFAETVEEQNKILHDLSLSDGLTGIANRRAFDERLLDEFKQAQRHKWPLSVHLIDVDYFKAYNDKYGHDGGDECLKRIAMTLDEQMKRNGDFVARYGGEEFACILPDTDSKGAEHVAQILLDSISLKNIIHEKSDVAPHVTVSIGIATLLQADIEKIAPTALLKQADQALYRAKEQGRNRLVRAQDISAE